MIEERKKKKKQDRKRLEGIRKPQMWSVGRKSKDNRGKLGTTVYTVSV